MQKAAAAERNAEPILSVLRSRVLGAERPLRALEVASGSGQHVHHFASALPHISWQPSELEPRSIASIEAYRRHLRLPNVEPPLVLDACESWERWGTPAESFDLAVNINMMHIAPMACTTGLFKGVGKILKPRGLLLTYGPYAFDGAITPQSNVDFDQSLRNRDAAWGLRDVTLLTALAQENGLRLEEIVDMPTNNKCLLFRKESVP